MVAKRARPVETTYRTTGVDAGQAQVALAHLTERIKKTWPSGAGTGSVKLYLRSFANVIDIGGVGLAFCTDGVSPANPPERIPRFLIRHTRNGAQGERPCGCGKEEMLGHENTVFDAVKHPI